MTPLLFSKVHLPFQKKYEIGDHRHQGQLHSTVH
ncbi:unnamed protein product, partial [Callosobruchus maculatus]